MIDDEIIAKVARAIAEVTGDDPTHELFQKEAKAALDASGLQKQSVAWAKEYYAIFAANTKLAEERNKLKQEIKRKGELSYRAWQLMKKEDDEAAWELLNDHYQAEMKDYANTSEVKQALSNKEEV